MARKHVDWEAIEQDYRAGVKTDRQLAAEHSISHTAIQKRAKRDGWERDLSERIRARAETKVAKDAVAIEVAKETEKAIVEANAELQAGIIRSHRKDIQRSRGLAVSLLAELEAQTEGLDLYEQLGELLHAPDEKGIDKLNELYNKVISLPSRVDSTKKLAETLKTLIGLERQAFGIADNAEGGKDGPGQSVMVYIPSNGR